jgi:hypothetical protein
MGIGFLRGGSTSKEPATVARWGCGREWLQDSKHLLTTYHPETPAPMLNIPTIIQRVERGLKRCSGGLSQQGDWKCKSALVRGKPGFLVLTSSTNATQKALVRCANSTTKLTNPLKTQQLPPRRSLARSNSLIIELHRTDLTKHPSLVIQLSSDMLFVISSWLVPRHSLAISMDQSLKDCHQQQTIKTQLKFPKPSNSRFNFKHFS